MPTEVRVAELLTALSLATDLGQGQPMDWELRSCLLALGLAERANLDDDTVREVYDLSLLRYIGCTSHAHEVADTYGDEIEARNRFLALDLADKRTTGRTVMQLAGSHRSLPGRMRTAIGALAAGTKPVSEGFKASCEVAVRFADELGFPNGTMAALRTSFERWDGHGFPNGASGEAIPLAMRVVQIAQDAEVLQRRHGTTDAAATVRQRGGAMYDPELATAFAEAAGELFTGLQDVDPWEAVLAGEPGRQRMLRGTSLDQALAVVADYTDLKSAYGGGHSRAVSDLAVRAATQCNLHGEQIDLIRQAALVHDLGTAGVPNSIWDKPGLLTSAEWERVRLHPYYTERILERSRGLADLAAAAGAHQERCDATGYHRASRAGTLPLAARIIAAADVFVALTEDRAHRPARSAADAAKELAAMATQGALDCEAVDAVLAAVGTSTRAGSVWPAGLSDREVEVLRLIVRGRTSKEVAKQLSISVKTVGTHIEHIYTKIGVSTRGAAALYAMQHDLISRHD